MSTALLLLAVALVLYPARPQQRIYPTKSDTRRRAPPASMNLDTAADVDLFAACIRSGLSSAHAAAAVARVSQQPAWCTIASLLAIGVCADQAWAPGEDIYGLEELAALARLSERSGAALTSGCGRVAENIRAAVADQATATAERAGVLIALPLTICFLPAFFVLGLAPTVISLAITLIPQSLN